MNTLNPAARRAAAAGGMPTRPGWYVQWCDRAYWRPVSPDFATWVVDQLIDGEKLVCIEEMKEVHQ
jgi:hypothetical protein